MTDTKMAIVVRSDITMSKGKTAAQVAHAAVMCAMQSKDKSLPAYKEWIESSFAKIVLKADSKEQLELLQNKAKMNGLETYLVIDEGRTEVEPYTVTCLGIGPGYVSDVDTVTHGLKLL